MARCRREDEPGSIHHVYNRAIARRPMFECRQEFRAFTTLLACAVRRGEIEILAYCLMHTHYHVVLRLRRGTLSSTMQRVQTNYSRYFNRRHRRDGPLMRGRFASRRIRTPQYLDAAVRYVEANGVDARLVSTPEQYEFGSARRRQEQLPPRWLLNASRTSYSASSGAPDLQESRRFIVEQRLSSVSEEQDEPIPLRLSPSVDDWMRRKRALADGGRIPLAVASPQALATALKAFEKDVSQLSEIAGAKINQFSKEVEAAFYVQLCGLRQTEAAARIGVSQPTVSRMLRATGGYCEESPIFERRIAQLAVDVARRCWPQEPTEY